MSYTDVLADIETLDTRPSAVALSIGLVKFNLDGADNYDTLNQKSRSLYFALDAEDQIQAHARTTSFSTIKFWTEQSKEASVVFNEEKLPVEQALLAINKWLGKSEHLRLWGNGATFDNVILTSLYEDYGVPFPFKFWNHADVRTLKLLAGSPKLSIPMGVKHHALDDAQYEVLCVQEYYRRLTS
jgi:hypothetical protein